MAIIFNEMNFILLLKFLPKLLQRNWENLFVHIIVMTYYLPLFIQNLQVMATHSIGKYPNTFKNYAEYLDALLRI